MLSLDEYRKLPKSWVRDVNRAVDNAVNRAVYRAFERGFQNDNP